MKELISGFDNLPMLIKIILAIPALHIVWGIYRLICAIDEKNVTSLIVAVVLMIIPVTWIFDIIWIILYGNVWKYKAA